MQSTDEAMTAMRANLKKLGRRDTGFGHMPVSDGELFQRFKMQDAGGSAGTGHVSRADFGKVLAEAFNTLPWADSPEAVGQLAAKYTADAASPAGALELVACASPHVEPAGWQSPFLLSSLRAHLHFNCMHYADYNFMHDLFEGTPLSWHIANSETGTYFRDSRHR